GDVFTSDSSHALFTADIVPSSGPIGDLVAAPTSGGPATTLGPAMGIDTATTGSRVVFNANFAAGTGVSFGTADIAAGGTSGAAPPSLLVTQADVFYFLTAAKDKIVYSWSHAPDARAGVWVLPLQ